MNELIVQLAELCAKSAMYTRFDGARIVNESEYSRLMRVASGRIREQETTLFAAARAKALEEE